MGVIGRDNRTFVGLIEDVQNNAPEVEALPPNNENEIDNNLINEVINVAAAAEVEEELLREAALAAGTPRKMKHRNPVKPVSFTLRSKRLGAKKHRRYENALQMLDSIKDYNNEEFDEVNIGDFMTNRMSAFSKLLEERENLKLWNDFVNCSDEKQAEILSGKNCSICSSTEAEASTSKSGNNQSLSSESNNPKVCFHRIGNGFRALLKKKQVPMGVLTHLESEVVDFFSNWPRSVYISQLPNGFERLILHALCQYLDLIAQSHGTKSDRHTRVENPRAVFQTPPVLLTKFIETNFR